MGGPLMQEEPAPEASRPQIVPAQGAPSTHTRPAVEGVRDEPPAQAAVQAVADATTSLMALLYGAFLGTLSALLVVSIAERAAPNALTPFQRAAVGLVVWVASTWWFSSRADRLVIVFRRAFALGALEWSALTVVGRGEPVAMASTGAPAPAPIASADLLTGGLAVAMIVACLAGWVVCRWWSPPAQEGERASA